MGLKFGSTVFSKLESLMDDGNCADGVCQIKNRPESFALQNLLRIQEQVMQMCIANNREPDSCRIVPVSKTISANFLQSFCQNNQLVFAENKVQELKSKYLALKSFGPKWHFVGYLQTNKVRECADVAEMIHSVDRFKLGQALETHLQRAGKSMDILVQVNTSGEASKFGVSPDNAIRLVRDLRQFETLKIKGLMTLAVFSSESAAVRNCFRQLKVLAGQIRNEGLNRVEMAELSMGMSSDYKIAIEEGSTIVRIGQEIFGPRTLPNSYYWDEEKA